MPASAQAIIDAANAEWAHWGQSTWNCITRAKSKNFHIDDEDDYAKYIIDTYCALFFKKPIKWPTIANIANDDYPWSAVTISYIMRQAGFAPGEFPIAQGHSRYLRWGIAARRANDKTAAYWGYRVDEPEAKPAPGDIVGCARGVKNLSPAATLKYFDRTGDYPSHSDIVVAARPGEVDVIGGNVRDSVTKKTLALNAAGQLADKNHPWFVVLKKRL